jgi:hypothetical protein
MGEVEKINLVSKYFKAGVSDRFWKDCLATNISYLAVSGQLPVIR